MRATIVATWLLYFVYRHLDGLRNATRRSMLFTLCLAQRDEEGQRNENTVRVKMYRSSMVIDD